MADARKYSIGELAELTGTSRRTVRFYVQKGLVSPPLGAGRGHYYTEDHLTRIRAIRELQEHGLSLDEIAGRFRGRQPDVRALLDDFNMAEAAGPAPAPAVPEESGDEPELWLRLTVGDGVELNIESGNYRVSPKRMKQLRRAVREILGPGNRALGKKRGEEK